MSVPYVKVVDREKHIVAYCPQCLLGKVEMTGLVMQCGNCGFKFDPDERAFMKLGSRLKVQKDGRRLRAGRPRIEKYNDIWVDKIVKYYLDTKDDIGETARAFRVSYSTVRRMLVRREIDLKKKRSIRRNDNDR